MVRLLVLTLIVFSQLFCQEWKETDQLDMSWSLYGGISSMSATADSYDYETVDPGRKTGFSFGAIKPISEKLSVGVGYMQRGWTDSAYWTSVDANIDEDWTISGIELWATYNLFNIGNNGSFWIGPSYAILSSVEAEFDVVGGGSISDDADIDDNDLSIMFGVSLPVGSSGAALNLGYQRSIIEVDDFILFNQFFVNVSFKI